VNCSKLLRALDGLENQHISSITVLAPVKLNHQQGWLNFILKHIAYLHLVCVKLLEHSPHGDAILEAFLLPRINIQLGGIKDRSPLLSSL